MHLRLYIRIGKFFIYIYIYNINIYIYMYKTIYTNICMYICSFRQSLKFSKSSDPSENCPVAAMASPTLRTLSGLPGEPTPLKDSALAT